VINPRVPDPPRIVPQDQETQVERRKKFHVTEIWISCGLVFGVLFTQASILARKQSGAYGNPYARRRKVAC
jgi:hypothetical protein